MDWSREWGRTKSTECAATPVSSTTDVSLHVLCVDISYVCYRFVPRLPDLLPRPRFARGEQSDDGGATPEHSGQAEISGKQRVIPLCSLILCKICFQVHGAHGVGLRDGEADGAELGDGEVHQRRRHHRAARPPTRLLWRPHQPHLPLRQTKGRGNYPIRGHLQVFDWSVCTLC